jgi:hypothetical protein
LNARPANHLSRLVLLAALAPAAACTSFEEVSTVLDLRVLAIETDPSEVVLKIDGLPTDPTAAIDPLALSVDPASIPAIHVTPLLVLPPASADRVITWSLVACPNNPYGPAPPAGMGGGPDPSGGARTTVGSTLCPPDGKNTWPLGADLAGGASRDVTFTPEQLRAAFLADVYIDQYGQFHGGFDLGLPMNLEVTATDGVDTVRAVKRVLFWATMLPGQVPNKLPSAPVVSTYRDRDEMTWEPIGDVTPLDPATPVHVALGSQLWLRPELPPDDVESYTTTVIDRNPPHLAMPTVVARERIRYAFYATAGHFDPPRSVSELPPGVEGTVHLESKYTPPPTLDGVPADAAGDHLVAVWVIVRDDRGGEKWLQARLALDPAAP